MKNKPIQRKITEAEFKEKWAFTVKEGYLMKKGNAVLFRHKHKIYALNGFAETIGYKIIKPIWKKDVRYEGARISIGLFIKLGNELK